MKELEEILHRVAIIESILFKEKELLSFKEACACLGFSANHLYKLCYTNRIPHHNPTGGTLYFKKTEINTWLEEKKSKKKKVRNTKRKTNQSYPNRKFRG